MMASNQHLATVVKMTVVMDGDIDRSPFRYQETPNRPATFRSAPIGQLGWIKEGAVDHYRERIHPPGFRMFRCLPNHCRTRILKASFVGDDGRLADQLLELVIRASSLRAWAGVMSIP